MGIVKTVNYRRQVAPNTAVIITKQPGIKGLIRELVGHWPAGCVGLVGVAAYVSGARFWPVTAIAPSFADGWVSLDDTTEKWVISEGPLTRVEHSPHEWILEESTLSVEIINLDLVNPHTISITISIEKEETEATPEWVKTLSEDIDIRVRGLNQNL